MKTDTATKVVEKTLEQRVTEATSEMSIDTLSKLGRELINLPGGRLARVRYAPIATKFRSAPK
jgi:hypothetical protein